MEFRVEVAELIAVSKSDPAVDLSLSTCVLTCANFGRRTFFISFLIIATPENNELPDETLPFAKLSTKREPIQLKSSKNG